MSAEREKTVTGEDFLDVLRREWGLPPRDPNAPVAAPMSEEEAAAHTRRLIREQRREAFRRFCPEEFRQKIDRTKIPNVAAWDEADAWSGGCPGLWLWSHETGEAKTRMLWRKFGQLHAEQGKTVLRVTGLNLAEEYHDCYKRNCTAQFYRHMCGVQVVMLDDLDKMPLQRRDQGYAERDNAVQNGRMLRELFDTFYEERTPVLVTANEPIAWFADILGPSTERRMRAVCREVAF
jgi:hypothetical protein